MLRGGLPVWHHQINARVKHGQLELITAATAPTAEIRGDYVLGPLQAIDRAIAGGPAPTADHSERTADRTLAEILDPSGLHLQKAWVVHTRTFEPPGQWVTLVDARSGELLDVDNEVRFANGTVTAEQAKSAIHVVQFSREYFDLAATNGGAMAQYIAFDEPVLVNLGTKTYRIRQDIAHSDSQKLLVNAPRDRWYRQQVADEPHIEKRVSTLSGNSGDARIRRLKVPRPRCWRQPLARLRPQGVIAPQLGVRHLLPPAAQEKWLSAESTSAELKKLLVPFPADAMKSYPVDKRVNHPQVDDKDLTNPTELVPDPQPGLPFVTD